MIAGQSSAQSLALLLGLFVLSMGCALGAEWLVTRPELAEVKVATRRSTWSRLGHVTADLLWVMLLMAAGLVAHRYVDRLRLGYAGYIVFALLAFGVSLVRAYIFRRTRTANQLRSQRTSAGTWVAAHSRPTAVAFLLVVVVVCLALVRMAGSRVVVPALPFRLVVVGVPAWLTPTPDGSFETAWQQYMELRGRTFAFADVEGTWRASGRRVAGRFEVLNAATDSFVLHDRYNGRVFTAGNGGDDHLYLNRIDLVPGERVRIKAIEFDVANGTLADSLSVLYEMQREPGLQHIFVSGDLIQSSAAGAGSPSLRADYSQTEIRRIEGLGGDHYRLNYATAPQLISMASMPLERADLVVVATYAVPSSGPTVTPLPTLGRGTDPTSVDEPAQ